MVIFLEVKFLITICSNKVKVYSFEIRSLWTLIDSSFKDFISTNVIFRIVSWQKLWKK